MSTLPLNLEHLLSYQDSSFIESPSQQIYIEYVCVFIYMYVYIIITIKTNMSCDVGLQITFDQNAVILIFTVR